MLQVRGCCPFFYRLLTQPGSQSTWLPPAVKKTEAVYTPFCSVLKLHPPAAVQWVQLPPVETDVCCCSSTAWSQLLLALPRPDLSEAVFFWPDAHAASTSPVSLAPAAAREGATPGQRLLLHH